MAVRRHACGSCEARRAAEKAGQVKYQWTGPDKYGNEVQRTYDKKIEVLMRVEKSGGTWLEVQGG